MGAAGKNDFSDNIMDVGLKEVHYHQSTSICFLPKVKTVINS